MYKNIYIIPVIFHTHITNNNYVRNIWSSGTQILSYNQTEI